MADRVLRDHSKPCEVCRHFSPEVHDGFLKPQRTCKSCIGAGGREVAGAELVRLAAEAQRTDPTLAAVWAEVFEQDL